MPSKLPLYFILKSLCIFLVVNKGRYHKLSASLCTTIFDFNIHNTGCESQWPDSDNPAKHKKKNDVTPFSTNKLITQNCDIMEIALISPKLFGDLNIRIKHIAFPHVNCFCRLRSTSQQHVLSVHRTSKRLTCHSLESVEVSSVRYYFQRTQRIKFSSATGKRKISLKLFHLRHKMLTRII